MNEQHEGQQQQKKKNETKTVFNNILKERKKNAYMFKGLTFPKYHLFFYV